MKRLALLLCLVVPCLIITMACDKDDGSGGGQKAGTATTGSFKVKITGPTGVGPLGTYTYRCATDEKLDGACAYVWELTGDGEIVGKGNTSSLQVRSTTSGGFYTLKLRVRNAKGEWSNWSMIQAKAGTVGFVINCYDLSAGNPFAGLPATGSAATWTMTTATTNYWRYSITFEGDTSGLPATIPVTITWQKGTAQDFRWGTISASTGSDTLNIPAGGATVGGSGSDFWAQGVRPNVYNVPASSTAGTVRFEAEGIPPLTITVVRP